MTELECQYTLQKIQSGCCPLAGHFFLVDCALPDDMDRVQERIEELTEDLVRAMEGDVCSLSMATEGYVEGTSAVGMT